MGAVYLNPSQPGSGLTTHVSMAFGPLAAPAGGGPQTAVADVAVLTLAGQGVTATGGASGSTTADVAAVSLVGQDVAVSATGTATVAADVATLTLAGQTSTVTGSGTASTTADVAALTLTGQDVTAGGGVAGSTTADIAALTLTGQTPTVAGTGTATVAADVAALTLTGLTSTVAGTGTVTVTADVAALSLLGVAVGSGGGAVTNADVATLTLTGQAVTVSTIPTPIQEGFRFRNDDGSETTATWLAAQDTNTSRDLAVATRLRMVLDTTTAPPSQPYTLYYKKTTDSTWLPVPVGSGGGASQSVRFNASGQYFSRSASGLNAATDMTWCCWVKLVVDTNTDVAILDSDNGGANYHFLGTTSSGTHFKRDTTTGISDSGFDFTVGTWCFIASVYKVTGNDQLYWVNAPGTTLNLLDTAVGGGGLADANSFYIAPFGLNGSVAAVKIWTAGLTKTELEAEMSSYTPLRTANLWANYKFDAGPQTTDDSGNGRTLTMNGTPVVDSAGPPIASSPVYIATSSNITASGEATTTQLTPPAGKTTADFCAGRMWDDENGVDSIDLNCVGGGGGSEAVTMTMWAMKPSAMLNENVTIRARVVVTSDGNVPGQGQPPGGGNVNEPVGTVTFYDGGTPMLTTLISNFGEADVVSANLSVGTHTFTAVYNGTTTYATGSAGPITFTVTSGKTAPTLSTWQANYDSLNLAQITSWYQYNTGHLAQGFAHSSLWNPAGGSSIAAVTVDAAWLAANVGANVVNDGGGHWTITGLHTTSIEIRVSNLTFNHCCIERQNFATVWGSGISFYEVGVGTDNVSITNIVFNYCTGFTDGTGVESGGWGTNIGTYGDAMSYDPVTPAPNQVVFNNCEFTQWRAGFLTWGGVTANYCWVHSLDLFGLDPHNTSGSIRDQYTTFYRNLFCDGTSSDVSLYADSNPYTNFWLTENIMLLDGYHADYEINFPVRGTGWSPLSAGYVRECVGNLMRDGGGSDMSYFTKLAGNRLLGTGKKLWSCADAVQTATNPSVLTLMPPSEYFGHAAVYDTFTYTPSPNSTLFLFQGTGQFAHATTPSLAVTDSAGGGSWSAVTGASTPIEGYWGNINYGMSASLVTQQPGATPPFRHLTIDPYSGSGAEGVAATMVVEVTGRTGMTLTQPVVLSAKGNATSVGAHLGTFTSGTLSSAATSGHLVMWFIAYRHDDEGGIPAPPAGWNMTGNNWNPTVGTALLWRKDFTGTNVTIADMGILDVAVSILCEFN